MSSHEKLARPVTWSSSNSSLREGSLSQAFREITNAPWITATALRVFLGTSHPKMPNLILTPEEMADVIAYILSLQDRR